jgi:ectoine hydroxylase-related dioxygenase (phytanoyl-CoA dioxygenase family)
VIDAQAIAEEFWQNGVVVLEGFLDAAVAARAARELDAVLATDPERPFSFADQDGFPDERATHVRNWPLAQVVELTPTCQRVLGDARLDELAAAVCGSGYAATSGMVTATAPGFGQSWHQDSREDEPGCFTLNRIVFPGAPAPGAGRLLVVPGSHVRGDVPQGDGFEPRSDAVALEPSAGTVVLMHSRTWHCVERNRSDRTRVQFNARTWPAGCPDDITLYPMFAMGPWNFKTGRPE